MNLISFQLRKSITIFIIRVVYMGCVFVSIHGEKIIKNMQIPSCKNCVHYQPNRFHRDFVSPLNKCENFGEKNIYSDKIIYQYADLCRKDESLCGYNGTYFEKENRIHLKIIKHSLLYHLPLIGLSSFIGFILYLQMYIVYLESTKSM